MIYDVQYHPVSDHVIHVDCLAVNKDEKTTAEVPVILVGESPFESNNLGRVQLIRSRLEVEALPLDLPHHIEVDVSNLTEEGQVLHISDIIVSDKVTLVDDPTLTVISTVAFSEEVEEEEEVIVEEETPTEEPIE
jgi:large subunit ribosomal protein L25